MRNLTSSLAPAALIVVYLILRFIYTKTRPLASRKHPYRRQIPRRDVRPTAPASLWFSLQRLVKSYQYLSTFVVLSLFVVYVVMARWILFDPLRNATLNLTSYNEKVTQENTNSTSATFVTADRVIQAQLVLSNMSLIIMWMSSLCIFWVLPPILLSVLVSLFLHIHTNRLVYLDSYEDTTCE